MSNSDRLPWTVYAGQFLAKCQVDLKSPDGLTRASAQTWIGVATADLKRSVAAVAHLNACLALEAA